MRVGQANSRGIDRYNSTISHSINIARSEEVRVDKYRLTKKRMINFIFIKFYMCREEVI